MNREEYWDFVGAAHDFIHESQYQRLRTSLLELPKSQLEWLLSHQRQIIVALHNAKVWCFCTVVFGDCGDSLFHNFREWASLQEQGFVSLLLDEPDKASEPLTKYTKVSDFLIGQLPHTVATERFGLDYKLPVVEDFPKELPGNWIPDDALESTFPKAWSLFHNGTTINPSQELPWPYDSVST
jgi:hypothetical protein